MLVVLVFISHLLLSGFVVANIVVAPFWYHCCSCAWMLRSVSWSFLPPLLSMFLSIISWYLLYIRDYGTLSASGTLGGGTGCFLTGVIVGVCVSALSEFASSSSLFFLPFGERFPHDYLVLISCHSCLL